MFPVGRIIAGAREGQVEYPFIRREESEFLSQRNDLRRYSEQLWQTVTSECSVGVYGTDQTNVKVICERNYV